MFDYKQRAPDDLKKFAENWQRIFGAASRGDKHRILEEPGYNTPRAEANADAPTPTEENTP